MAGFIRLQQRQGSFKLAIGPLYGSLEEEKILENESDEST